MELKYIVFLVWLIAFVCTISAIVTWQYIKWRRLDKRGKKFKILWDIHLYATVTSWHLVFVELGWGWAVWAFPNSGIEGPAVFINMAYFCLVGVHGANFMFKIGRPIGKAAKFFAPYAEELENYQKTHPGELSLSPKEVVSSLVLLIKMAKNLDGDTPQLEVTGGTKFEDLVKKESTAADSSLPNGSATVNELPAGKETAATALARSLTQKSLADKSSSSEPAPLESPSTEPQQ